MQFSIGDEHGYRTPVGGLTKHMDMSAYCGVIGPYFHAEKTGDSGGDMVVTLHEMSMEFRVR